MYFNFGIRRNSRRNAYRNNDNNNCNAGGDYCESRNDQDCNDGCSNDRGCDDRSCNDGCRNDGCCDDRDCNDGCRKDGCCGDRDCDDGCSNDGYCGDRDCDNRSCNDGCRNERNCDDRSCNDGCCNERNCDDRSCNDRCSNEDCSCNNQCMNGWHDYGSQPLIANIDDLTKSNPYFRNTLWTGRHMQVTLMSIEPGEDIGLENHRNLDQFIRIESGEGRVMMGTCQEKMNYEGLVNQNHIIIVPAGTWHNLVNVGRRPLKVYSVYGPPAHKSGTIHETQADASEDCDRKCCNCN